MNELNGMITKTKHRIENFAAHAKTAVTKAGDAVRDAAESTGEKVRDAAMSTGGKVRDAAVSTSEKVRDAAMSTARRLEDAGRDVSKKIGISSSPRPKVTVQKLSLAKVRAQLPSIPGWKVTDGKLYREFRFADFDAAFAFITKVAKVAEEQDHHPEWSNAYDVVRVYLSTHDVGGISQLDFQMAAVMNAVAAATEQRPKASQSSKDVSVRGGTRPARRSARPSATRRVSHA